MAELKAANVLSARHRDEIIFHAWHTAAFSRVEKLPKLSELLKQTEKQQGKRRKRTWQEVEASLAALTHKMKDKG